MPHKDLTERKRYATNYRATHQEEIRRGQANYRKANRKSRREYTAAWYQKHKKDEKLKLYHANYRKTHRKEARAWSAKCNAKVKREIFILYGPRHRVRCAWPKCTISDIDMLALDHKNNDRKNNGGARKGTVFYHWLRKEAREGRRYELQVLCCNHNHKKELLRVRGDFNGH
jgi:hypothetical protein